MSAFSINCDCTTGTLQLSGEFLLPSADQYDGLFAPFFLNIAPTLSISIDLQHCNVMNSGGIRILISEILKLATSHSIQIIGCATTNWQKNAFASIPKANSKIEFVLK